MQTCLRLGLTVSDEILYYNTLFTDQLHVLSDNSYDFVISMNYTSTFKKALKKKSNVQIDGNNFCYIHGNIKNENIVIGTDTHEYKDEISAVNMLKIPFYKFFQRILNKTDENYTHWINKYCYELTFYGFSFGINDYDLITELIKMNEDQKEEKVKNNLSKVIIYYLTEKDKYNYLVNLTSCLGKDVMNKLKYKLEFKHIN